MFAGRHVGQASVTRDPSHRRPSPTPRNTMSGGFATRFLLEVDELLNQVRVGVVYGSTTALETCGAGVSANESFDLRP